MVNSVSVFQSVSISTASLRAVATAALKKPRRAASRTAQFFNAENFFTRPIHFSRLISSRRQAQKGAYVFSAPKPRRVIDQRNKIQRHDGADTRNDHQSAGDRMRLCIFLTKRGMGGNEPVRDTAQHSIALPCSGEMVSEALTLFTFPYTSQTDAKGLENSPDMALEILAKADQMRSRADQAA